MGSITSIVNQVQVSKMVSSTTMILVSVCCVMLRTSNAYPFAIEEAECDDQGTLCRKNGGSVDECTASMRACKEAVSGGPPEERLSDAVPEHNVASIEETECDDQGALCRKNGGSVDECTASTRTCKESVNGGPPKELSDAAPEAVMASMEETECDDQGALCRKNGGSVDECVASTRACKEAVRGGPPEELLSDATQEDKMNSIEEDGRDGQEAIHRENSGSVDEGTATKRPPKELLSKATAEGASMEEAECDDQGVLCRKNGGSVDECAASIGACKEAVSGGPPQERLSDVLHEETVV